MLLAIGNEGVTFNNSSSMVRNNSANVLNGAQQVTVCCWLRARSLGEDSYGRVICIGDGETANDTPFRIYHKNQSSKLIIDKLAGGNDVNNHLGQWEVALLDGHWHSVCVRLDFSGNNAPTVRINKRPATATPLETPNGIQDAPGNTYTTGNNSTGAGTWFGQIAHMQVWNRILSDAEADAAADDPGSVTNGLRLYLALTSATDTNNQATSTGSAFNPTTITALTTHAGFHDRERALGCTASGGRIMHTRFFCVAGQAAQINRPDGSTGGQVFPFDEEMFEIDDLSIYRCYKGIQLNAVDSHIGSIECEYVRDYGVHFNSGGAYKIRGPIHVSGCNSGRPDKQSPCVWFGNERYSENPAVYPHPGASWGGPWYVETADIGMLIESSGNKLGPFCSHTCNYGNLRITGERNSISNFEIDVVDGVTEINGREGIYLGNQSCMLLSGTIGGGAPVPNGEIAVRVTNGTRQVLRDINFVGTDNSTAPLISVAHPLNDSVIDARCFNGGTFLDLYRVTTGTARDGDTSTILLDAREQLASGNIVVAGVTTTITITGGTGVNQTRTITAYDSGTRTATVSSAWTTVPDQTSTYVIEGDRLGSNNRIYITAASITSKNINLDPTGWDKNTNLIIVNGVRVLGSITGATNANPIVITSAGHELRHGELVTIDDVEGNTNANGSYYAKVLTVDTFSLYTDANLMTGRAGNGTYTSNTGYWGKRFNSVDAAGN